MAQSGRLLDLILLYLYFFCNGFWRMCIDPCVTGSSKCCISLCFMGFFSLSPALCYFHLWDGRRVRTVKSANPNIWLLLHIPAPSNYHSVCLRVCSVFIYVSQVCLWFVSAFIVRLELVRHTCAAPGWQMPCHDGGMLIPRGSIRTRLICCEAVQNEKMLIEPKDFGICHTLLLLQSLDSPLAV